LTGGDFNGATENHRSTPRPQEEILVDSIPSGNKESPFPPYTHSLSLSHFLSEGTYRSDDRSMPGRGQSVTLDRSLVLFLCERRTVPPHHDQRPPRRRRRPRRHRQWEFGSLVASMVAFIMTTPSSLLHRMQGCDDGDWPRPVVRLLEQGKGPLLAAAAAPDMESAP
jgi:hypothetical protein